MEELFKEKLKWFIGGGTVGLIAGINFLFGAEATWSNIAIEWMAKFFGTIMLTFVSGLATVIAHDFYKHKIQNKLFKNKPKDDERKKDAA